MFGIKTTLLHRYVTNTQVLVEQFAMLIELPFNSFKLFIRIFHDSQHISIALLHQKCAGIEVQRCTTLVPSPRKQLLDTSSLDIIGRIYEAVDLRRHYLRWTYAQSTENDSSCTLIFLCFLFCAYWDDCSFSPLQALEVFMVVVLILPSPHHQNSCPLYRRKSCPVGSLSHCPRTQRSPFYISSLGSARTCHHHSCHQIAHDIECKSHSRLCL